MNKAFVREPDETDTAYCPRCGSLGTAVEERTIAAHLRPEALGQLAQSAFFCPFPKCDVVYFDKFERTATIDSALHPVYPKDPSAPMCGCFGFTRDDVEADVREGGVARVRALLAKSKSPEANCLTNSPSGQCCMPEVQRYFMKLRAASSEGAKE